MLYDRHFVKKCRLWRRSTIRENRILANDCGGELGVARILGQAEGDVWVRADEIGLVIG